MPWMYNVLTYVCALEANADAHNAMVKKSYMLITSSKSISVYKKGPTKKLYLKQNSQQYSYLTILSSITVYFLGTSQGGDACWSVVYDV